MLVIGKNESWNLPLLHMATIIILIIAVIIIDIKIIESHIGGKKI